LHGYKVNFYELPEFTTAETSHFKPILETKKIEVTGIGSPKVVQIHRVTTAMNEAIGDAKLIYLAMAAQGHEFFFGKIVPYLRDGHVVVFTPGNFGSLRLRRLLDEKAPGKKVTIYETNIPAYAARVIGPAKVHFIWRWGPQHTLEEYPLSRHVFLVTTSAFPAKDTNVALEELQELCPLTVPARNILTVWFSNPSNLLHPISTILNMGFVEYAGDKFFLWRDGATPSVVKATQAVADEISRVAQAYDVETAWFKDSEGVESAMKDYRGPSGLLSTAAGPGTVKSRYISEDAYYGLVPISQLAKKVGVATPIVDGLIAITSAIYQEDCMKAGLNLEKLGIAELNREQIIALVKG